MEVWQTLFHNKFDTQKYLYHYTSFDKALKIINSNKLLFSSITNTNDTTESKLKISFDKPDQMTDAEFDLAREMVLNYFNSFSASFKLMCFSMDSVLPSKYYNGNVYNNIKDQYYDYSGRGFALPRMWAQYANNNTGVCFIFNKQSILEKLSSIARHYEFPVSYKPFTQRYKIAPSSFRTLYEKISHDGNGNLTFYDYVIRSNKRMPQYIEYNYFTKLDDWANEQEYRILALVDDEKAIPYIDKISSSVEGIVLAEKIDESSENVIRCFSKSKRFTKDTADIKKVKFDSDRIKIE